MPSNPPVVLVSQLGTGGDAWQPVIDCLPESLTTVTYDRPGTGNCPPRPAPNPPLPYSAFADELAAVLDERGITRPAVLVGHSIGSLIVRVFAARYPDRVAGVVHVDGSIPRSRFGHGLYRDQSPVPIDGDGPDATAFDILRGEIEVVEAVQPDVPAAVITRTLGRWSPWVEPHLESAIDALWTAYQRQLARQLGTPLVVATDSGHQIPDESAALVAHVIGCVVDAARTGRQVVLDEATVSAAGGVFDDGRRSWAA